MSCELRFHGESWGWEAQILQRGELSYSRRFLLRQQAVQWAEEERKALDGGGGRLPGGQIGVLDVSFTND